MPIPASVDLYVNWDNGVLASGTYTAATPDKPNAHTYTFTNATLSVEAAAPWNGQTVAHLTSAAGTISSTISSATMQPTAGRGMVELNEVDGGGLPIVSFRATTLANGNIEILKSGTVLRVQMTWNSDGSLAQVDMGTYPTVPFAVEFIYDANNGTANQRLRARTWNLGSSAGSMNNATSSVGSAAATDQFTSLKIAPDVEISGLKIGRIAISDSISEDLSALDESAGGPPDLVYEPSLADPRNSVNAHLRM